MVAPEPKVLYGFRRIHIETFDWLLPVPKLGSQHAQQREGVDWHSPAAVANVGSLLFHFRKNCFVIF